LPMRGCVAEPLGVMRYRCMASPGYRQRWFPQGMNRSAARLAPVLSFDRKDRLQADFLLQHFGLPADAYPCHTIPASEAYLQAVCLGLGWGMIPEVQLGQLQHSGVLVDLVPEQAADVGLFWHRWKVQSPRLELMSSTLVQAARRVLLQP
jgi:LysR family transcriptional regulator (chromosome initiation inhibitor)